jgi:hypothetical protein
MKTNTTNQTGNEGAQLRSEQSGKRQKYNLFVGEEIYGFLHANSQAEALARIAVLRKPFRIILADE